MGLLDELRALVPPELLDRVIEIERIAFKESGDRRAESTGTGTMVALRGWERSIERIGKWTGAGSFEYQHCMNKRTTLHKIAMLAYEREYLDILDWLLPLVEDLDEEFRAKTTPDVDRLFWQATGNPTYWWERRMPNDNGLMKEFRAFNEPEAVAAREENRRRNQGEHLEKELEQE